MTSPWRLEQCDPGRHRAAGAQLGEHRFLPCQDNDAEFDALVLKSKTTVDEEERIAALEAANKLLMEKAYAVPILNSEQRYAYNSAYGNVTLNSQGIFYLNEFTCN